VPDAALFDGVRVGTESVSDDRCLEGMTMRKHVAVAVGIVVAVVAEDCMGVVDVAAGGS